MSIADDLRALFRRGGATDAESTGSTDSYSLGYERMRSQPMVQSLEQRLIIALSEPHLVVRHRDGEELTGARATTAAVAQRLIDAGDGDDQLSHLAANAVVDALQVGFGLLECPLWPPSTEVGPTQNARGERWRYIPTTHADAHMTNLEDGRMRVAWSMRRPSYYWLDSERWRPDEVVKLRFDRDPAQTWRGRGTLSSLGQVVFAEFHQLQLQSAAIANAPVGYLGIIEAMNEPAFKQLVRRIRGSVSGRSRGSLAMFHVQGLKEVQALKFDPGSMRMNDLQVAHEALVDQSMGVPPPIAGGLLGALHTTYENYRSAERVFYRNHLQHLWMRAAQMLTTQWLHRHIDADPELVVDFDLSQIPALQEDRNESAMRIGAGYNASAATLNQYVEAMGLPSYGERGDVLRIGNDFIPVEDVLGPANSD